MQLSKRLDMIASLVTEGMSLADIGTDHGYIPIYLVEKNKNPSAIAMDINEGPLCKAKKNVERDGLESKIELRLSDGMEELKPGEVDSVVIAGMGGLLMIRILEKGKNICESLKELILSPHSDIDAVRHYLQENGFAIVDEKMVIDDEKYYTAIKAVQGKQMYTRPEMFSYGKVLLEKKDETLKKYLVSELNKYEGIVRNLEKESSEQAMIRMHDLNEKCGQIRSALEYYL